MSVFYNDFVMPEESAKAVLNTSYYGSLNVKVVNIRGIPNDKSLIYWEASNGRKLQKSSMQSAENQIVEFNQEITIDIELTLTETNGWLPASPFLILDIFAYQTSDKSSEFIGRVMIPMLSITKEPQSYTRQSGKTVTKNTSFNLDVRYRASITSEYEIWDDHLREFVRDKNKFQFAIHVKDTKFQYPGEFELEEVFVENVLVTVNGETYKANVILTNFRLIVLPRQKDHSSLWLSFNSIMDIEKSYSNTLVKPRRVYSVRCFNGLTVKISTPFVPGYTNFKGNKAFQTTPNSTGSEQGDDWEKVASSELSTSNPLEGDAVKKNVDPFMVNVDEFDRMAGTDDDDDEDEYPSPLPRVGGVSGDLGSMDSFDCLGEPDTVTRVRKETAASISSFTSYIRTRTKSASKKPVPQHPGSGSSRQHPSKVYMDNVRLRVLYRRNNPNIEQPFRSVLAKYPLEELQCRTGYRAEEEHLRQGDLINWLKIDNTDFRVCRTYPPLFYIPVKMSEPKTLESILNFRSKERIPALSWLNNSGALLLRSAQPRVGIRDRSNPEDEAYLRCVYEMSKNLSGNDLPFVIFDARSKTAARGNKMKGKGTENIHNYTNTVLYHLNMANIHALRESHDKLVAICQAEPSERWHSKLEQTQWMYHLHGLVKGAALIARHLIGNGPCLVHCSDGWDRTSQLVSLALLLVDPFYRTLEGFQVLVEKEWLHFGHRFHDRGGLGHPDQRSPVFLLWLHGVYQLLAQFPTAFQVGPEVLLLLAEHHSSNWTTTFLRNCPAERTTHMGLSLWGMVWGSEGQLTNTRYTPHPGPLSPNYNLRHLVFWREFFLRYDNWSDDLVSETTSAVIWTPDSAVTQCTKCEEVFTALRRKHHCRLCGNIFCRDCSKKRVYLPEQGYNVPVIVCERCYLEHTNE